MRTVEGLKVAFIGHDEYFSSLSRQTSMTGVAKDTGADMVFLLAPGKSEHDLSDAEVSALIDAIKRPNDQVQP